jgi:hypothetical protein
MICCSILPVASSGAPRLFGPSPSLPVRVTAPHESNRIELLPDSIRFELISIITVRTDSN